MQEAFLPSMPDDMQAIAQEALGPLQWYRKSTTTNKCTFIFRLCPPQHYMNLLLLFLYNRLPKRSRHRHWRGK